MTVIVIPTRDQLEELFPTTGHVNLDPIAAKALAAHASVQAQVSRHIDSVLDLNADGSPVDERNPLAGFHYLNIVSRYLRMVGEGQLPNKPLTAPESVHWFATQVSSATPEQAEYLWRSMELVAATRGLTGSGEFVPIELIRHHFLAPFTMIFQNVMNAYALRRYPHIRFRVTRFVYYVLHPDEVDAQGVPRVSLDGYNFHGGLVKI